MPISWLTSQPLLFLVWILAIITALTFHEFAHGLSAYFLGDKTAKDDGRLTFNPLAHIDPIGFLMLLFAGFGWAKPVMVNPYNLKKPRSGMAWVALAGPLSNLLLVFVFGFTFKFLEPMLGGANLLINFLFLLAVVNASLFLFNLLPIPPLDGSKVFLALIPDKFTEFKFQFETYGPYILLGLLILDSFFSVNIFGNLFGGLMSFLLGIFI